MLFGRSRIVCFSLVVVSATVTVLLFNVWRVSPNQICPKTTQQAFEKPNVEEEESPRTFPRPPLLNGDPTRNFSDNLRPELQYVTGFNIAGFTNQFMSTANLVFLSLLTRRTPILPPFMPFPHMPSTAGMRKFSEVFDLQRWGDYINKGMVDWEDVKIFDPNYDEQLGCWSTWVTANIAQPLPPELAILDFVHLDPAYTPIPPEAKLLQGDNGDVHVRFNDLADLGSPSGRKRALDRLPKPLGPNQLSPAVFPSLQDEYIEPDEKLLCFDILYYVASTHVFEWEQEYGNAWHLVGKYARWSDKVRSLGRESLASTLGVSPHRLMVPTLLDKDYNRALHGPSRYPRDNLLALEQRDQILYPFIAIHARRGDFRNQCKNGTTCYPPLSSFQKEVDSLREEIWQSKRIRIKANDVIVTSDETANEWWHDVAAMGWKMVEIPESEDPRNRPWDLMLAELAIQSWATGFIGTQGSSLSLLSRRRVEEWQNGIGRLIK